MTLLQSIISMQFERIWVLYAIPAMILLLIIFLSINTVRFKDISPEEEKRRKRRLFWSRFLMFFSRCAIFTLLLVALAAPYHQDAVIVEGEPKVTILMDGSASMGVFELESAKRLVEELKARVGTQVYTIGSEDTSDLGDGVLSHLEEDRPVLLISDGQVNSGTSLESVAVFAGGINSSLSALELEAARNDVSVYVDGPSTTLQGVETDFLVQVSALEPVVFTITVTIDGREMLKEQHIIAETDEKVLHLPITSTFEEGDHTIKAELSLGGSTDAFPSNNVFYKTVHTVKKPKILMVTKGNNPTLTLLRQVYEVETLTTIPTSLKGYSAVVLHDVSADKVDAQRLQLLTDYLNDGNGMVVLGGLDSFDLGGYEQSAFEGLLPVQVGSGEEQESNTYVVLLLDISRSTSSSFRQGSSKYSTSDVIKAQAISMLDTLKPKDNVGVVAFNDRAYLVSHISPLEEKKSELVDKIARLRFANTTYMNVGLMASYQILREVSGSKSIVVLSDGQVSGYPKETLDLASKLGDGNIHVYTVGVGAGTDKDFMKTLAREGEGIYFEPSEFQKLKILFGEPEAKKTEGLASLIILNSDHFITQGLTLTAKIGAYNSVVPKRTAKVLVTLETGEPAVTVSRQGLGRVVSVNVFTTNSDLGELVNKENSKIVTRMMNWAIGDPERNSEYAIFVDDTTVGKESFVRVRSEKVPSAQGLEFYRDSPNEYVSSFIPKTEGVFPVLTTTYAVNAPAEYTYIGMDEILADTVTTSGGQMFKASETQEIVDFLKRKSTRTQIEKINYTKELVFFVLGILLVEIFLRRVYDTWIRGR